MNSLKSYFSKSTIKITKIAPPSSNTSDQRDASIENLDLHISASSFNDSTDSESTTPFQSTQESTQKFSCNLTSKFFKKLSVSKIVSNKSTSDSEPEEAELSEAACFHPNDPALDKTEYHSGLKPIRPFMSEYPKNENGHQFRESWYSKYTWLEYSKHKNAAFCFACRHFGDNNSKKRSVYTKEGYTDFRKATEKFDGHQKSKAHTTAALLMVNRITTKT